MKHLVVGLLAFFAVSYRVAANLVIDYSSVDKLAQNVPAHAVESIDALVAFGKINTKNDPEAVRFYFVWLAQNIQYDSLELTVEKRRTSKQEPDSVFLTRKGICRGYADLLTLLCQKANIPVRTVSGYSKSVDGATDTVGFHAWNIIKMDNIWQLFDVTWASNYWAAHNFDKNITLDESFNLYFQQNAAQFIKRHFPFDPAFQLNTHIVLRGAFFFGDTEGGCESPDIYNFETILEEEAKLSTLEQSINTYQRAVTFIPEERRLYDVLSYFKSEKAHIYFEKANKLLDDFTDIKQETINAWSLKDIQNNITQATEAKTHLLNALKLYESMTFIEVNADTELKKSNMLIIHKNINATEKLLNFLNGIEVEIQKIPLARL
jgi:Transglutaminase-like superfamily